MLMIHAVRKVKALLIRFRFHAIFDWLTAPFMMLSYLSKLSRWASNVDSLVFNDFYSQHHDYDKRYDLYEHLVVSESLEQVYYVEFGVSQGHSFKWWVNRLKDKKSRFVGFDTFTGLPEDWGHFKKGDMSADGCFPDIHDERCQFVKGVFQETLPSFLKTFQTDMRKVIHMDADIYSSTLFALTMMGPYLQKGDLIIFDEFNVPLHEFKAFIEFSSSYYVRTKLVGTVNNFYQTAFRVEDNLSYYGDPD